MRVGGGGAKGAEFEREIARRLSMWVTSGKRDDCFWRVAMSGGRATMQARKGKTAPAQIGDIGSIDPLGDALMSHVVIELKFHKKLDIVSGFVKKKGLLYSFWLKLCEQAASVSRAPMMIARENRMPTLLFLPEEIAYNLEIHWRPVLTLYSWPEWPSVYHFDDVIPVLAFYEKKRGILHKRKVSS